MRMKWWMTYIVAVNRNCGSSEANGKGLSFWRNNLFSGTIIYLLPFCLIALLPSLYWIFVIRQYILAVVDILTVLAMIVVAFVPGMSLVMRKIIFISCVYTFSCIILYYVGLSGPGLIYLLASSIFAILIFPTAYPFWPACINACICLLFGIAVWLDVIPWPQQSDHSVGAWMAVSSNLIFLSFLSCALIPRLFRGLQETILKEKLLKEEVNKQQQSLQQAMVMLQQKNNELEQFAYVASHDLKEPLRMVISFMGLLKEQYGPELDEKANTYIGYALDGGKRMQKMIADLLELSRTAHHNAVKEWVNLGVILVEVKQNIFQLIEESKAEIIIKADLPLLAVYRVDITRLLQNLLSNAIKFRKKETNPVIHFDTTEKEEGWLFSIQDNGIGIKKEKFEKIFEIFTRLHSQETYEGTGIGLAVCKKVVEHHGGKIWVESEEGNGSTFHFIIQK
jgi:signal transduction histidine kinase